jgi:hypothetical protein
MNTRTNDEHNTLNCHQHSCKGLLINPMYTSINVYLGQRNNYRQLSVLHTGSHGVISVYHQLLLSQDSNVHIKYNFHQHLDLNCTDNTESWI